MFDEKTKAKVQTSKDYYYILGVRPDATRAEIEESYQELYDKFGPHVNVKDMDPDIMIKTFKDICDAYEVLMDPVKRKEYDKASANTRQSASELRALWSQRTKPAVDADRQNKVQALALEMELEVTLKEAIKGTKKQLKISDPRACEECSGQRPVNKMQCASCRGLGYFNVDRTEEVELPGGMFEGMDIRKPDQGRFDLRAGRYGDLILKIRLLPHPVLTILGRDVTCTVPVTIYEAMLGAEIEVPCATGKVVMKIQPLTQPGRVYRLKGLGLAGADQLVTVDIVVPQQISGEEVALFKKLREISREPNPRDGLFKQM